jgi:DNA-directed RNA polymerase I subunit RPA43
MLSLVGSIQPDPFSPEHVPQSKPDRAAQSPQPPPRLLSEPVESDEMEEGLEETMATREEEEVRALTTRGKKKREKGEKKEEKAKRKRKQQDNAVAKSERKPKRKKSS